MKKQKTPRSKHDLKKWEEYARDRRKEFREDRRDLLDSHRRSTQRFDAAILALSSATLGFSINQTAQISEPKYMCLLIISWVSLGITVILVVISFQIAKYVIKKEREINAEQYRLDVDLNRQQTKELDIDDQTVTQIARVLEWVVVAIFCIGLVSFIMYLGLNSLS